MAEDFIDIEHDLGEAVVKIHRLLQWPEVAKKVIERHLDTIVKDAKKEAPVDTGALRDSIRSIGARIAGDLISGEIEVGVDYASFQEKRVHFLSNALEDEIQDLVTDLQRAFNNLLK